MEQREKNATNYMFVVLSEIWLDDEEVCRPKVNKWMLFFSFSKISNMSEYSGRTELSSKWMVVKSVIYDGGVKRSYKKHLG